MRRFLAISIVLFAVAQIGMFSPSAEASVLLVASGISAKDVPVTFKARLAILEDTLTVTLINDSPVDSLNPDDVLGSFYFDILDDNGNRPLLVLESATGNTYKGNAKNADTLLETGADIKAFTLNDCWQFKSFDDTEIPYLGFGLGTVGNGSLSLNSFNGNIVGGIGLSIFKGEITTRPLENPDRLVKDSAVFVFSGVSGFTEADISENFAFGLGTAPDSLITSPNLIPEPATLTLLTIGGLALLRKR